MSLPPAVTVTRSASGTTASICGGTVPPLISACGRVSRSSTAAPPHVTSIRSYPSRPATRCA